MPKIDKNQVIDILERIAILLELRDANVFKIRAFENAARILQGTSSDLETLIKTGELETLKGIGKGHIARILHELYETGHSRDHKELCKGFPETLFDLLRIPGLGAKRVRVLYVKLKIDSLEKLRAACEKDKLRNLEGFGAKSQENILRGLENLSKAAGQFLIETARAEAEKLVAHLKKGKGIRKIEIAGSIRRSKEIVKDIDILVTAENPAAVHQALIRYPGVKIVVAHGETKSSVTLSSGMNCDLRTVSETEFPYALYYFTGSKGHNVAVRTLAKKKGIKVNEYGLFRGSRLIPCKEEADIFKTMGLHYIPPEARENTGEVEWAQKRPFPPLVEEKDIRGVFHVHSTYSDGVASLEDMIRTAEKMGLDYVGISDHSQSARYAGGLQIERVKKQWKEIDQLQKKFKVRIFKGIESDILADGSLDYPEPILAGFDFIIGSIHSRFNLPEKEMTERLRRAVENKYLTFMGHPTGRLLLKRAGFRFDMPKIFEAMVDAGVVMEVNAQPERLDLDWRHCHAAKARGVKFSIHPDAHSLEGMHLVPFGVGIARKGWLEKKDVVNTLPLAAMEKFLRTRR